MSSLSPSPYTHTDTTKLHHWLARPTVGRRIHHYETLEDFGGRSSQNNNGPDGIMTRKIFV